MQGVGSGHALAVFTLACPSRLRHSWRMPTAYPTTDLVFRPAQAADADVAVP